MSRLSPFRSGAFRLGLLYAGVFAVGSIVLVVAVERAVNQYAIRVTTDTLLTESARLSAVDRTYGRSALVEAIRTPTRMRRRQFQYLLIDRHGAMLAGDLPASASRDGWGTAVVTELGSAEDPGDETTAMKTYGAVLADGSRVIVASDTYDIEELRDWLNMVALWSGIAITVLALFGGYVIAAIFTRRLENMNSAIDRIMRVDLRERLPVIRMGEEFDLLAANLNLMLDRIEALMVGLRQVSTDIAHDLRTPLTRLRQHLESATGDPSQPVPQLVIEHALSQIDEIMGIFGALLRIGTIEAGAGRSRLHNLDLSEIMERVVLAYQPVAEDGDRIISGTIQPGILIAGDDGLLAQLFTNLVENALVHTPLGTLITLTLVREQGRVTASVSDNGPGIPATERDKVLQRFVRLDPSRASSGAGLGLALVAAIAALHGAELRLADNHPGLLVRLIWPESQIGAARKPVPGGTFHIT